MRIFFVAGFLCLAASSFSLTNVNFDNDYAIFRPTEMLRFDLDKQMEILFLEKLEKPTLENSVYGLVLRHNHTKYVEKVHSVLYERGRQKSEKTYEIEDVEILKNMELTWDPAGFVAVSVKKFGIRSTKVFSWPESVEAALGNLPNISYIAVKSINSSTYHQVDSFLWISDLHEACPRKNAYFSCDLKINRLDAVPKDDRNTTAKGLRKIMHVKLQSGSSSHQQYYELTIAVNETADKAEPHLFIMKHDAKKVKMDTIFGDIVFTVNVSAASFVIGRRNDSTPLFLWRDPEDNDSHPFVDLKYVAVQIAENAVSFGRPYGSGDKTNGNSCRIFCNPTKELPWYTRWKNKLKETFTSDNDEN